MYMKSIWMKRKWNDVFHWTWNTWNQKKNETEQLWNSNFDSFAFFWTYFHPSLQKFVILWCTYWFFYQIMISSCIFLDLLCFIRESTCVFYVRQITTHVITTGIYSLTDVILVNHRQLEDDKYKWTHWSTPQVSAVNRINSESVPVLN